MAAQVGLGLACLATVLSLAIAGSAFDSVLGDVRPCVEVCENTYPSHTYEKGDQHECCKRGCRFYSIMEFVHEHRDENATQHDCMSCCQEAYNETGACNACVMGCRSQRPTLINDEEDNDGPKIHLLYPLMYVHSMYSNMINKMYRHMSVSWSFYMQADNGQLVVIKSQPQVYSEFMDAQDLDDYRGVMGDYKTANYMETNIEPLDSGATPILKNSQMRAARSFEDGLNLSSDERTVNSDWLTCLARKSGIPRLFLCLLILFCAMVMIWLCLTAAVTAPDHKIHSSQKLSINGDLEYLRELGQGKGYKLLLPQDKVEASPLPIKIRVEKI